MVPNDLFRDVKMPSSFQDFKPLIITLESDKLTNITGDEGGLTKYGITQVTYPNVDIANLTFEQACDIYERDYWNHYFLSNISSQAIANKLMSYLMNMTPLSAIKCLQKAIVACGGDIPQDGILGSETFKAINLRSPNWLLDRMRIEGVIFYNYRVKIKPTNLKFLEGWINRALL